MLLLLYVSMLMEIEIMLASPVRLSAIKYVYDCTSHLLVRAFNNFTRALDANFQISRS